MHHLDNFVYKIDDISNEDDGLNLRVDFYVAGSWLCFWLWIDTEVMGCFGIRFLVWILLGISVVRIVFGFLGWVVWGWGRRLGAIGLPWSYITKIKIYNPLSKPIQKISIKLNSYRDNKFKKIS